MLLIGVILLGLWIAGLSTSYTLGGFIHALLVLAVVALLSHMIRGNSLQRLAELRAAVARAGSLATGASLASGLVEHSCPCCRPAI